MTDAGKVVEVKVDVERLEQVDSFVYLGSRVTNDADCADEVKLGTAMGMAEMVTFTKMWKNRYVSQYHQ